MSRLPQEWQRLYAVSAPSAGDTASPRLTDAQGRVRAAVVELARPADWAALSDLWKGVQVDLDLPAPGIAVNGCDGYQLWFSLQQPVAAAQALAFLQALCRRYRGDVLPGRLTLWPVPDTQLPCGVRHAATVPAEQGCSGRWSAFVAWDLAPVFADEPWLEAPPNEHGQSELLSRLDPAAPDAFDRALLRLGGAPLPATPSAEARPAADFPHTPLAASNQAAGQDAQRFLRDVMNDERVDLALRVEAAKALLPYGPRSG